jgi:hypothetical protein
MKAAHADIDAAYGPERPVAGGDHHLSIEGYPYKTPPFIMLTGHGMPSFF